MPNGKRNDKESGKGAVPGASSTPVLVLQYGMRSVCLTCTILRSTTVLLLVALESTLYTLLVCTSTSTMYTPSRMNSYCLIGTGTVRVGMLG